MTITIIVTHLKKCAARSRQQTRRNRPQRGQAAVEIALILPLLLVILFGIIVVGFIFYAHIQVSNAVRESARAGSIYRLTQAETGWTLQETVQKTIYNSSTGESSLGFLPTASSQFRVSCTISVLQSGTYLSPTNCTGVTISGVHSGDRVAVSLTYSYTVPIIAVALPMFPQPLVMRSNVMMEIQ